MEVVREEGFEPPRACARQVLSLLRLPVPPFPRQVAEGKFTTRIFSLLCFSVSRYEEGVRDPVGKIANPGEIECSEA